MRLLYSSDIYKLIDDLYEVYLFNYNYYVVTEFYLFYSYHFIRYYICKISGNLHFNDCKIYSEIKLILYILWYKLLFYQSIVILNLLIASHNSIFISILLQYCLIKTLF